MGLLQHLLRRRSEKRIPVRVIEEKDVTEQTIEKPEILGERKEMINEVQNLLKDTNERIDRVWVMVEKLDTSVGDSKKAIEDKVHTEGVKIYRNVQAVLVDLEKKMATQEKMNQEIQTLKNYLKGLMGVSAITMIILVIFVLFSIGVF